MKTCTRNHEEFLLVISYNPVLLRHVAPRPLGMQQSDFEEGISKYFDIASKKAVVRSTACSIEKQVAYL